MAGRGVDGLKPWEQATLSWGTKLQSPKGVFKFFYKNLVYFLPSTALDLACGAKKNSEAHF